MYEEREKTSLGVVHLPLVGPEPTKAYAKKCKKRKHFFVREHPIRQITSPTDHTRPLPGDGAIVLVLTDVASATRLRWPFKQVCVRGGTPCPAALPARGVAANVLDIRILGARNTVAARRSCESWVRRCCLEHRDVKCCI